MIREESLTVIDIGQTFKQYEGLSCDELSSSLSEAVYCTIANHGKRGGKYLQTASSEFRGERRRRDEELRIKFAKERLVSNPRLTAGDLAKLYKNTARGKEFTMSTLVTYFQTSKLNALNELIKK
ncbi:MAG: hypothetical protein ACI9LY_003966 [Arenicella sp.]|jgi:hypothetical protein